jgi:FPC/CPF motif-containing protein YcgG
LNTQICYRKFVSSRNTKQTVLSTFTYTRSTKTIHLFTQSMTKKSSLQKLIDFFSVHSKTNKYISLISILTFSSPYMRIEIERKRKMLWHYYRSLLKLTSYSIYFDFYFCLSSTSHLSLLSTLFSQFYFHFIYKKTK